MVLHWPAYIRVTVQSAFILPVLQQHLLEIDCITGRHCGWADKNVAYWDSVLVRVLRILAVM